MYIRLGFDYLFSLEGYLVQLYDVGMPKNLQDADLSCHTLDIGLFDDFLLLQCLYCHFLGGMDMDAHSHLPKSSLPDALT